MISGIAFDRPDSLGLLRAFPDHFKIYTDRQRSSHSRDFSWPGENQESLQVVRKRHRCCEGL